MEVCLSTAADRSALPCNLANVNKHQPKHFAWCVSVCLSLTSKSLYQLNLLPVTADTVFHNRVNISCRPCVIMQLNNEKQTFTFKTNSQYLYLDNLAIGPHLLFMDKYIELKLSANVILQINFLFCKTDSFS